MGCSGVPSRAVGVPQGSLRSGMRNARWKARALSKSPQPTSRGATRSTSMPPDGAVPLMAREALIWGSRPRQRRQHPRAKRWHGGPWLPLLSHGAVHGKVAAAQHCTGRWPGKRRTSTFSNSMCRCRVGMPYQSGDVRMAVKELVEHMAKPFKYDIQLPGPSVLPIWPDGASSTACGRRQGPVAVAPRPLGIAGVLVV